MTPPLDSVSTRSHTVVMSSVPAKGETMTPMRRAYLAAYDARELTRTRKQCQDAIRLAWPNRHGRRARIVISANVQTLRDLRAIHGA